MKLKKINAILGLTIIAALVCHVGTMTYSLITYWYDLTLCKFFAHAAVTLMILHILTSLCIFFFFHDGSSAHYLSMNKRTIIQRITAILMIILVHFHIFAYSHMATGETLSQGQAIFRCFTECIFIISAFVHTSVSFSKALTTLGVINSSNAAKIIDKVVYTVCTVAALAALYAVLRFFGGDII